jgi:hypothetical protein
MPFQAPSSIEGIEVALTSNNFNVIDFIVFIDPKYTGCPYQIWMKH